jgi:hypothetical protein
MEGNRKSHGASRGTRTRTLTELLEDDADDLAVDITSSFPPEEGTNPGIDPELQRALASLSRVQANTTQHASDIEALLVKRKTPFPR